MKKLNTILIVISIAFLLLGACASGGQATGSQTIAPVAATPTSTFVLKESPVPPTSTISINPTMPTPGPVILTYADALPLFQYDPTAPFDLQVTSSQVQENVTIQDITYHAVDPQYALSSGGRIQAYIITPPGKGPFAGILYLHGLGQGWGNRKEFLNEAISLAHQGVVSLLPSGLFPWTVDHTGTGQGDQMNVIKQVDELRRSLDLLLAQPGVDPQRIAYVGHDYGGMHGAVMAGVDKRVKAFVLMTGDINYSHWAIQYFVSPPDLVAYRKAMTAVDPISYVPHASPAALYFQFAKNDSYVDPKDATALFDASSQPKKIDWYDAGHTLNDQATKDRLAWLTLQLDLQPAP